MTGGQQNPTPAEAYGPYSASFGMAPVWDHQEAGARWYEGLSMIGQHIHNVMAARNRPPRAPDEAVQRVLEQERREEWAEFDADDRIPGNDWDNYQRIT